MTLVLLSAMLLSTLAASGQTTPTLGFAELSATTKAIRTFKPKDEFDSPPKQPSLADRSFSVTVAPLKRGPDNKICDGFPSWGYFVNDGHYEVGANAGMSLARDLRPRSGLGFPEGEGSLGAFVYFASFGCERVGDSYYEAKNALGAATRVHRIYDVVLAFSDREAGMTRNGWSTAITGDAARQLSQAVRIRITGTLKDWSTGQSVICALDRRTPTFQLPMDRTLDICVFRTQALHFEVVDSRTGEVLSSGN